jgi:anthranilate synthase component 1
MHIEPSAEAFAACYIRGGPQVVWTTLVADLDTPVSAFLKTGADRELSFLLESVEGGAVRGRYSIIGLDPDVVWRARGTQAEINRNARVEPDGFVRCPEPPLAALRAFVNESRIDLPAGLPPMAAGVFGYLSYDMVRLMEELPPPNPDPIGIPDAILVRATIVIIFDSVLDTLTVVTPVRPAVGVTAERALARAIERLTAVVDALDKPLAKEPAADLAAALEVPPTSNTTPEEFHAMVAQAKEYIAAGDIFQVVLAQRFEAPFALPPFALYRALRRVNPAPFLFYLDYGGFAVAGSSPEILVRARGDTVTIRPIAGTKPRGPTPHEDKALEEELLADPKERAEHLMLLDLGRNDVGRVAQIGTVVVTDQFFVERYSQVMHIVSNVEGKLDKRYDGLDALAAGFPAGTVSGAPKVRAMEIIDELEKEKRGLYAGCVGYFSATGDMDSCIVLRTALVKDGRMYVQAGAGIVADSNPASEQQECINKAKALFRAAEEARRFASAARKGQ